MSVRAFTADLHIHTVLSPCARRDMLPHCIVLEALEKGLDCIAVTDHNACDNVAVTLSLGERFGLWVIPGIEVETREEVHLLAYFPTLDHLLAFNHLVEEHLLTFPLDAEVWGEEWVIGEEGNIVARKASLLTVPVALSLEDVVEEVERHQGVAVLAHVDRKAYSVFSQLGFLPPALPVKALEISPAFSPEETQERFTLSGYPLVSFSDAHGLSEIGQRVTLFWMASPRWEELLLALSGEKGRGITLSGNDERL